jgi:hypothetical protein
MDAITPALTPPDPTALLRELTADTIRARLVAIEAEARSLRVLLRSVAARERAARRRQEAQACE